MASWKSLQPSVVGGISSVLAEVASFPFDLTKTRLQIQGQVLETQYAQMRYRGFVHAVTRIFREEGFLAFYSGLGPAAARQLAYGAMKRGLYEGFQNLFGTRGPGRTFIKDLFLGLSSGAISAFVCNPADIMKVRMQSQGISFKSCYRQLRHVEGLRGLGRGLTPNLLRTSVIVGVSFSVYDEVKRYLLYDLMIEKEFYFLILASTIAAMTSSLAANPFDVIKSRMMNQKKGGLEYKNVLECAIKTARLEGPRAFLKGYGSMLCRTVPWNVVFFASNEILTDLLGGRVTKNVFFKDSQQ